MQSRINYRDYGNWFDHNNFDIKFIITNLELNVSLRQQFDADTLMIISFQLLFVPSNSEFVFFTYTPTSFLIIYASHWCNKFFI